MIINVTGGPDLSLLEVSEASTIIQEVAHEDANIIFGAVVDESLSGKVKITVIATGFERGGASRQPVANTTQTPVDLSHYSRPQAPPAAAMSRPPIVRRPAIDLPQPMALAAGGENQVIDGIEEPSPLDVPAFMRRQHEG